VALIPLGMLWWLGLGVVLLKRGLVTLVSHNFEDYRGSSTR
jgi:hypothetical protein